MAHRCPTVGCTVTIHNDAILMCKRHWFELMREERDQINKSYRLNGPGLAHMKVIQPILDRQAIRMNRGEYDG